MLHLIAKKLQKLLMHQEMILGRYYKLYKMFYYNKFMLKLFTYVHELKY